MKSTTDFAAESIVWAGRKKPFLPDRNRPDKKGLQQLFGVFLVELGVFFLEFLNPSSRIDQFLLTSKKGMTGRTYLHLHLGIDRSEFNGIATGALGRDFMVFWVYIRFHIRTSMEHNVHILNCINFLV